jgi:hypothetical protein
VSDSELPPDLRAFLYSCVDAVEQADIIVLLHGSEGAFTAGMVARELGLTDGAARHHLETLVARGLLQIAVGSEVSYRYAPRSGELRRFAELLIDWWGHSRSAVLRFIATDRRSPLQSFSNAFRIRRKQ